LKYVHHGPSDTSGVMGVTPQALSSSSTLPHQSGASDAPRSTFPFPSSTLDTAHGSSDVEHRRPWMTKMDFPHFDWSDVRVWIDKCTAYFHLHSIPHDFKVTAVALHMVDKAVHWFQSYKQTGGSYVWENFVDTVTKEFELNTH
jgi:hypothetical protein